MLTAKSQSIKLKWYQLKILENAWIPETDLEVLVGIKVAFCCQGWTEMEWHPQSAFSAALQPPLDRLRNLAVKKELLSLSVVSRLSGPPIRDRIKRQKSLILKESSVLAIG